MTLSPRTMPWLALLLMLNSGGCGGDSSTTQADSKSSTSSRAPVTTRGQYEPMVSGTPEELLDHAIGLERQFRSTDETGPREARAAMLACTEAQITTAEAILNNPSSSSDVLLNATRVELTALARRSEEDPKNLDRLLETVDRIIERFPDSRPATLAAHFRVNYLNAVPVSILSDQKIHAEKLFDAALALGKLDASFPSTPAILYQLAPIAELVGHADQSRQMYELLAERFPNAEESKSAAGHAHRLGLVGKPVGRLAGPTLDGTSSVSLDDLKGKIVLVEFWDSTCLPCVQEFPVLSQIREKIGPENFEILGINLDPSPFAAANFLKKNQATWPQISVTVPSDILSNEERAELPQRFGLDKIPLKLLVDREGTLLATGMTLQQMKPALDKFFPGALPPELDEPIDLRSVLPKPEKPNEKGQGGPGGHAH